MYRKFKIMNERLEELNLSEVNRLFLEEVEGLGKDMTYEKTNVGNYVQITNETMKDREVKGTLKYGYDVASSYQEFINFSNFISRAQTLTLSYTLPMDSAGYPDNVTVYAECKIASQKKSEATNGRLEDEVKFLLLEPWKSMDKVMTITYTGVKNGVGHPIIGKGKEAVIGSEYLKNLGDATAPLYFRVDGGYIDTPEIVLENMATGAAYDWQWMADLMVGDRLEHDSAPGKRYVKLNGVNAYDKVLKNPGFSSMVVVPPGEYRIHFLGIVMSPGATLTLVYRDYWSVI